MSILGKRYFNSKRTTIKLTETQEKAKLAIEKLIKDGTYQFESVPCLCEVSSENDLILATRDRYGLKHQTVICQNCGLIRTNPKLTQYSYNHFYENWYRQLYSGYAHVDENGFRLEFESMQPRGKKILEFLEKFHICLTEKTILEIGSGGGWNLLSFEQIGAKTIGFDYGSYIEFGRKLYGLDLRYGSIEEAVNESVRADIVILSHVIEHFTDPITTLKDIRKVLKYDGVCYLETPGILNIHNTYLDLMGLLQNAHTYTFSMITLSYFVKSAGYEVQYCDEFIRMLCKPLSTQHSSAFEVDLNHSTLVIKYLKDCEKKRLYRRFDKTLRSVIKRVIVAILNAMGLYNLSKDLYHKIKER
jgi:2-polyprenyl-3-methyl-5-hydroxy-6-metoxy-1,4-benzoquinol methylase